MYAKLSASPAPTGPAWTHGGTLQPTGTSEAYKRKLVHNYTQHITAHPLHFAFLNIACKQLMTD